MSELKEAYHELSTCRPMGMGGIGPIPWTAIDAYADREQVEDREAFLGWMRMMDRETLQSYAKQQANPSRKGAS